jgi:putative acetyltransferase
MANHVKMVIRKEQHDDVAAIHALNSQAFGSEVESNLVDLLRENGKVALSMVAEEGGSILGHILYSPVTITTSDKAVPALGLGPMAVLPSHQRRGIGSALIIASLEKLRQRGEKLIVLVGHPEYYPQFGFRKGSEFGLRWEMDCPDEVFMVLELIPGSAPPGGGAVRYAREFTTV